jgi:hypothetical protein
LSEGFGRLRQASLSDSSTVTLRTCDKSAFVTSIGGGHGGRGSGGREQGGRGCGRGRGPRKCTYCCGENHSVELCQDLHGKPAAHQVSLQEVENVVQSLLPNSTTRVVSILEEEYHLLMSMQSQSAESSSTVTLT